MSDFKAKLDETRAAVETGLNKFKQSKADMVCMDDAGNVDVVRSLNRFEGLVRELEYIFSSLNDRIDYLSESYYSHTQNHLPPVPGPAGMQSAIKALRWDDDYTVQPGQVYAGLNEGFIKVGGQVIN